MAEALADGAQGESGLVSPERLIYFSDAVIAIAITLLALELPVPSGVKGDGAVLAFLGGHAQDYVTFLISFGAVAMYWLAHQRLFRYARGLVGPVIQWNLLWLLMIVLMPFTAKLLTGDLDAFEVQFAGYALGQALAGLFLVLAFSGLRKHGLLRADAPASVITNTMDWLISVMVMFALSIPVAFVTHWASLCWLLVPVIRIVLRTVRRTTTRV